MTRHTSFIVLFLCIYPFFLPLYGGSFEKEIERKIDSLQWKSKIDAQIAGNFCGHTSKPVNEPAEVSSRENQIEVYNTTAYEIENLIRWVGRYLNLRGIRINIYSLPRQFRYQGVLTKRDGAYDLYLKRNLRNYKLIAIHEMIHIEQFESQKLEIINESVVHYKGKSIDILEVEYDARDFEIEAHAKDHAILRKFNKSHYALSAKKEHKKNRIVRDICKTTDSFTPID